MSVCAERADLPVHQRHRHQRTGDRGRHLLHDLSLLRTRVRGSGGHSLLPGHLCVCGHVPWRLHRAAAGNNDNDDDDNNNNNNNDDDDDMMVMKMMIVIMMMIIIIIIIIIIIVMIIMSVFLERLSM